MEEQLTLLRRDFCFARNFFIFLTCQLITVFGDFNARCEGGKKVHFSDSSSSSSVLFLSLRKNIYTQWVVQSGAEISAFSTVRTRGDECRVFYPALCRVQNRIVRRRNKGFLSLAALSGSCQSKSRQRDWPDRRSRKKAADLSLTYRPTNPTHSLSHLLS